MNPGLGPEEVVELKHGLSGIAELTYAFYTELRKKGFLHQDALALASAWLVENVRAANQGKSE